nr:MAG TPA: hypothetical protein [Bacteriophage sp.]
MKKFIENNPIDIIEALCRMGDAEQVGKFEMPWSKDNSSQMGKIRQMFVPNSPGNYSFDVVVNESQVIDYIDKSHSITTNTNELVYNSGFYLYSYNEELPTDVIDTYTMKVLVDDSGYNDEIYLYYLGD